MRDQEEVRDVSHRGEPGNITEVQGDGIIGREAERPGGVPPEDGTVSRRETARNDGNAEFPERSTGRDLLRADGGEPQSLGAGDARQVAIQVAVADRGVEARQAGAEAAAEFAADAQARIHLAVSRLLHDVPPERAPEVLHQDALSRFIPQEFSMGPVLDEVRVHLQIGRAGVEGVVRNAPAHLRDQSPLQAVLVETEGHIGRQFPRPGNMVEPPADDGVTRVVLIGPVLEGVEAAALVVEVEAGFQDGIQPRMGELQVPAVPPLARTVLVRMGGITDGPPGGSELVLEQADEAGRRRVITQVAAHGLDDIIAEPQRRPGMELHPVQRLQVRLRLADRNGPGFTGPGGLHHGALLLRQPVRHPVPVHVPHIHLHRLRRRGLEDGVPFRSHGPEPELPVV